MATKKSTEVKMADEELHEAHEREHLLEHMKKYWLIFGALIIGTVLTVVVAEFDIGGAGIGPMDIAVGLLIATVKASLVALFFMHLSDEKKLIYQVLVFAAIFVAGMFILSLGAFYDKIEYLY